MSKALLTNEVVFPVDLGHGYVKTAGAKFPSKVKVGTNLIKVGKKKRDTYHVELEGQSYVVGDGRLFTGEDRYTTVGYKLALLTSIAANFPNEDFIEANVVLGVPIERQSRVQASIVEYYKGMQSNINVDGREVTIRIKDVRVTLEGAYPVVTGEDGRVLTIDMGAGTVNVTEFDSWSVEKYATYNDSMHKMYQDIATYLNEHKGGDFAPSDIEPILNKNVINIKQVPTDITGIRPIIADNIAEVASLIRNKFAVDRADVIYLIGGGAMDTYNYWHKEFPTADLVADGQMCNLKAYEVFAEMWRQELEG